MKKQYPASSIAVFLLSTAVFSFAFWLSITNGSSETYVPNDPGQRADSTVIHPRLISHVEPVYPQAAREAELEAGTILQLMIHKDGSVEVNDKSCIKCEVKRKGEEPEQVLHGWCDDFCGASIEAVTQWKYEPGKEDGEPVEVYFTVVIDYVLQ